MNSTGDIINITENLTSRISAVLNEDDVEQSCPRPGVFYGRYPCTDKQIPGAFQRILGRIRRTVRLVIDTDDAAIEFVDAVKSHADSSNAMSEDDLDEWITQIRRQLHSEGITKENMILAFAAIREVSSRVLGMAHFDSQIRAGYVMMLNRIAEMQTGEGKTLTATLPAACAAMAGTPVHLITANDYLVQRDHQLMAAVFDRLGLSSAHVRSDLGDDERRNVYGCDIVYCTAPQLVFDYLKDRMIHRRFESDKQLRLVDLYTDKGFDEKVLLRGLNFAIIDEIDGVLIDEARTPLILSRQSDQNVQESMNREAVWLAKQLEQGLHFEAAPQSREITLKYEGEERLKSLTADMLGIWQGEKRRVSLVKQALSAIHNFRRDIDYVVIDDQVIIIDENTGRMMPDRKWEAGLHQMIEEKEGCAQSGLNETIARISFQRFFARYHRLAGMTGTASEAATEFSDVYSLDIDVIPTHRPSRRMDQGTRLYRDALSKWRDVVQEAARSHRAGRPVLIGTRTVEDSESLSSFLHMENLPHQVLNAKQDSEEADIISKAGQAGQITVATNMAGRGTDIPLSEASRTAGGLHVISCEKNLSSRIDRQLYGRCARQGDPGSFMSILSLDDELVSTWLGWYVPIAKRLTGEQTMVKPQRLSIALISLVQWMSEHKYRKLRNIMMKADKHRDSMLSFSGQAE